MEVKSGTGLTKIEPKRKPVKYSRGGAPATAVAGLIGGWRGTSLQRAGGG